MPTKYWNYFWFAKYFFLFTAEASAGRSILPRTSTSSVSATFAAIWDHLQTSHVSFTRWTRALRRTTTGNGFDFYRKFADWSWQLSAADGPDGRRLLRLGWTVCALPPRSCPPKNVNHLQFLHTQQTRVGVKQNGRVDAKICDTFSFSATNSWIVRQSGCAEFTVFVAGFLRPNMHTHNARRWARGHCLDQMAAARKWWLQLRFWQWTKQLDCGGKKRFFCWAFIRRR